VAANITASDKCGTESMCLTFAQYMQLTRQQYEKYINATNQPTKIATVILTSEQASIVARRHNYSTSTDFPFQFVVNEKDAGQGTGEPEQYGIISGGPDADKIMLSTLVALKMQLMAKYTVVNCCSSFHRMILDLLRAGCGAAAEPEFRCLQEMEDPQYHLCCKWDQDEQCQQAMLKFRDRYENATQNYS
jgi:prenyltransferase beta subunit